MKRCSQPTLAITHGSAGRTRSGTLTHGVRESKPGSRLPFLVAVLLMVATAGAKSTTLSGASPNILLILTDDQGWSQLSGRIDPAIADSYSRYLSTPNMNRLADGGVRFTSGYSPAPLCTPTRRSVLCGTSAARSGTEFASPWVPAEHMTIPKALKQVNPSYRCAHFGKWGEKMISSPEECGYDTSDGSTGNVDGGMENKNQEYFINEDPKRTGSVTGRAIRFMREQKEAGHPFYVQVSYYAVHLRVELLERTLNKYREQGDPDRAYTAAWAGMLEELDTGIGELLDALDRLEIADTTYVFFMSDNGGRSSIPGGDQARLPTNHPLSGAKHSLLEGGIRVPFFVRGPGIEPGSFCHAPVSGYDLLPTFYDLAGGERPLPRNVDGGSFAPLMTGSGVTSVQRPVNALIFHRPRRLMSAVRQNEYKLLIHWDARSGLIGSQKLFNVRVDPGESRELTEPDKSDALRRMLEDYLGEVNAETVDAKERTR